MAPPDLSPLDYAPKPRARIPGVLRQVVLIAVALGAVVVIGFIAIRLMSAAFTLGTDAPVTNVAEIEKWGHCRLPASASSVRAHLESWQDYLQVRFDVKPADLQPFLDSSGIKQPLSTTAAAIDSCFLPPPRQSTPWWTPAGQPKKFETGDGEVHAPGGATIYQRILIDESDPETWTIWFVAFDT